MRTRTGFLTVLWAVSCATAMAATNEVALFDGRTLKGWREVNFIGKAAVLIKEGGVLELGMGEMLTGLVCTNPPARMSYEITLEARRTLGSDFFCGLTFPVASNSVTLVVGGWGGSVVGLSSIDGLDASENATSRMIDFAQNRWYRIRVRVVPGQILAWLDDQEIVKLETADHRLGMRPGDIEMCVPLGLATWQTRGEIRNIRLKRLAE